jgi:hypothetical protein
MTSLSVAANQINDLRNLSDKRQWKKLLHLNEHDKSYIISDQFFFSGSSNPYEEMSATISAFERQENICKLPSRAIFLNRYGYNFDIDSCTKFTAWKNELDVTNISVLFASGYMANPASIYGHILIRFNNENSARLLNTSINYGAKVPPNENGLVYVAKGLFGGYEATYSDQHYYRHEHNYADKELRDLWNYTLDLTKEDVELLVAHIYEILPFRFDYYFVSENCAFHVGKLIEIVTEADFISENVPWSMPSSLAKALTDYKDGELIEKVDFIPSAETRLSHYAKLVKKRGGSELLDGFITQGFDKNKSDYQALSPSDKKLILEALLEYELVASDTDNKKDIISETLKLPPGRTKTSINPIVESPHKTSPPSLVSIGGAVGDINEAIIGFRMNFFDELTFDQSQKKYTALEILDSEIGVKGKQIKLNQLTLARVQTMRPNDTDLSYFDRSSWRIDVGYRNRGLACFDCNLIYTHADYGLSAPLFNGIGYTMVGIKAETGTITNTYMSATAGIITNLSNKVKIKIEAAHNIALRSNQKDQSTLEFEANYLIDSENEIRISYGTGYDKRVAIIFNHYWDF